MNLRTSLLSYLPVNLASAIAGFGGVYVFTRLLGPEAYGRYALVLAAFMLVHTATLVWVEAAVYRFHPRADRRGALATLYATARRAWVTMAVPASLLAIAVLVLAPLPQIVRVAGGFALMHMLFASLLQTRLEVLKVTQQPLRFSVLETWRLGAGFLFGVAFVAFTDLGPAGPFAGMTLACALAVAVEGRTLWRAADGGRANARLTRLFAHYAVPLSAVLLLDIVLSAGDRFVIAAILGEAAVGIYAAAYGIADRLMMILFAWAGMAASPLLIRAFESGGAPAAQQAAGEAAQVFLLVAAPAAVGLGLVAGPLAQIIIAEDMRAGAAGLIPWIAAGSFLNGFVVYYFAYAFQLTRRTREQALCTVVPAIANIALNIALIPLFGLPGAVIATVAAYALAAALFIIVGRRRIALPIPLVDLAKIGCACALMALVVQPVPAIGGFGELVLVASVGATAYIAGVLVLNAAGARAWLSAARELVAGRATPDTPEH